MTIISGYLYKFDQEIAGYAQQQGKLDLYVYNSKYLIVQGYDERPIALSKGFNDYTEVKALYDGLMVTRAKALI